MSLSLNKFFSVKPSLMAGIAIGRKQVCAVVLDTQTQPSKVRGIYRHDLSVPLFAGQSTAEAETALADALHTVSTEFRTAFAAVHIALPDTVIRSTVSELDELPKSADMRVALLRWRFSREWQRPEDSLDCRGLDLGKDQDKRLLFGQAGDRLWIDCVRRALTRAAINPWSLNAASSYRYNRFHDVIAGGEGALLSLDADCWNLLIWDGAGRIRRVVTRLRDNTLAQDEMKIIADEAERALLSYAGSRVGKLYLAGSESEMAALAMMPGSHFHEKALLLHADTGLSGSIAGIKEGMAPLALAAALNI